MDPEMPNETFADAARLLAAHRWSLVLGSLTVLLAVGGGALVGLSPAVTGSLAAVVVAGAVSLLEWRRRVAGDGRPVGLGTAVLGYWIVAVAVFGLIQLVPYGRDHSNPAVTGEPAWATPRTRELMVDACFGCHSNEVQWPWYSNVAPFSWAVTDHVEQGRDEVNYSEFDRRRGEADETVESILEGEMPPGYYTRFGLHPEAALSDAERQELIEGLRATPGLSEHGEREDDD
jgi:hypothetical protein